MSLTGVCSNVRDSPPGGGVGVLPYMAYTRVCAAQRGLDFEDPDSERGIHFRGAF